MRTLFIAAVLLSLTLPVLAEDWDIVDYNVDITVQRDGVMKVVETIDVDFSREAHHGIYRLIPIKYQDRYGAAFKYRLALDKVTDLGGVPYQVHLSRQGHYVKIRIGDPERLVQQRMVYVIAYTLDRGIRFFDNADELYWNPIGTEWAVPIHAARCLVHLPQSVPLDFLEYNCWTGPFGSRTSNAAMDAGDGQHLRFEAGQPLRLQEGMTIFVSWPKGIVKKPEYVQRLAWFMSDNGMWFIPILLLLGMTVQWNRRGRDPSTGRSVTTTYDPPDNLTPGEIGTLIDERAGVREITSTIVDLAVRGYIRIEVIKEKALIFTKTDYRLVKLKEPDKDLSDYESYLMARIFGGEESRLISSLKNVFYTYIPKLNQSPAAVRSEYLGIGAVVVAVGVGLAVLLSAVLGGTIMWGAAIGVCGLVVLAFSNAMPRRTAKGARAFMGIKGFEDYLSTAEKETIQFQERQGCFDKYLPYAMVLNVADQWARAFEGIASTPPNWYAGPLGDTFSPSLFTHDLTGAAAQMGSGLSSSPSSSGGGGGGGGGGAW
jgi:hypothetical protein